MVFSPSRISLISEELWANVFIEDDDMVPSLDTSSESFSKDLIGGVRVPQN